MSLAVTTSGALLCKDLLFAGQSAGPAAAAASGADAAINPFAFHLEVHGDGSITITSPQTEIGQGIADTLSMVIADEMDADWSRVKLALPHANLAFANPVSKRQRIGGSDSVMAYREPLRQVGAAAREMLVAAAAARWQVPAAECRTEDSRVIHSPSGRVLGYGELATAATALPVPAKPTLKPASALRLTGRRHGRKDTPPKVDGAAVFAVDVREPGMVFAALRRSQSLQGRVQRFDAASVSSRPGVLAVVPLDDAVAVVADSWWKARQAAEALDVVFDEADLRGLGSDSIAASTRRALTDDANALEMPLPVPGAATRQRQPADRAAIAAVFARNDTIHFDATYEVPYLAHMTLEPQSCVAKVTADSCHVWGGLQQPDFARDLAAKLTGLPVERVRVDVTFAGGGFGRRWELDSVRQAVSIAKAVPGRAVNLIWTREQDLQHDFYRPAYMARYRARLDRAGNVLAVHGRIAGQSLLGYKRMRPNPKFPDGASAFGVIPAEYDLPNALCDSVDVAVPVPVGFWRAVGASQNGFFAESMIDELAHAARRDPLEFRRSLIRSNPRALAVLERAAAESGWGKPLAKGRGRGFAMNSGFGSICAQVFEVSVAGNTVTIDKVTCVYDCGPVLNPATVEAQLEGGISWGLCAALNGEITIAAGRVQQGNFHEQTLLRINEMPRVRVVLMDSAERIGGVGEGGVPPVAAALCNAIFAATGRRLRSLPLRKQGLEFAVTRV